MIPTAKECKDLLLKLLGDGYRYNHSLKVATYACNLSTSFNDVPLNQIEVAALLHDVAKQMPINEAMSFIPQPYHDVKNYPAVVHAYAGAYLIQHELGIKDPQIINAIMCHTTGKAEMSHFDLVLYIADYTASLKEEESSLASDTLDTASYYPHQVALDICKETLLRLMGQNKLIHPDTLAMYNWLSFTLKDL